MTTSMQWRVALLAAILALCTLVAAGYAFYALNRAADNLGGPAATTSETATELLEQPHIAFRHTADGVAYGKVAAVALSAPDGPRALTDTSCERVYSVGKVGLCLDARRGVVTTYGAKILDKDLLPRRDVPTAGEPSRVRLSADGRLAATTTFEAGHSYLSSSFSTRTVIYNVKTGKPLHNLEDFTIWKADKPYSNPDVNMWGVTFKPGGDGFYATMASQGVTYLVEGSIRKRTLRTLRQNVECPSLSPDGTRIAYKKRDDTDGFFGWRVHVLDLRTGADVVLPTDRSVDDQVEWLDDKRVLYGLVRRVGYVETDVWVVPANGTGKPSVLIPEAWSPAVVRTPAR